MKELTCSGARQRNDITTKTAGLDIVF